MMIRTLLVDDAPLGREGIRIRLSAEDDFEVVGEASDGYEAAAAIEAFRPDLVFLDIRLPRCDGFETLARVGQIELPLVVIVTAYGSYAVKAFEARAIDYLLKPINARRFQEAIQRVRQVLGHAARTNATPISRRSESERWVGGPVPAGSVRPSERNEALSRVLVKQGGRLLLIRVEDLDWIESAGDYVQLHAQGRSFLIRATMHDLDERLDWRQFARIHRSSIVNINRIQEIWPQPHGIYKLLLRDGTTLPVGRAYRDRLLPRL